MNWASHFLNIVTLRLWGHDVSAKSDLYGRRQMLKDPNTSVDMKKLLKKNIYSALSHWRDMKIFYIYLVSPCGRLWNTDWYSVTKHVGTFISTSSCLYFPYLLLLLSQVKDLHCWVQDPGGEENSYTVAASLLESTGMLHRTVITSSVAVYHCCLTVS